MPPVETATLTVAAEGLELLGVPPTGGSVADMAVSYWAGRDREGDDAVGRVVVIAGEADLRAASPSLSL
jgi:hypothetical protein